MKRVTLFISYALISLFVFNTIAIADDGVTLDEGPAYTSSYDFDNNTPSPYVERERPVQLASNRSYYQDDEDAPPVKKSTSKKVRSSYYSRLPQQVSYGEKVIIVNPRKHVWGAYSSEGNLLRAGLATAGASWCPDIKRGCRTKSGSFRIQSLGSSSCKSTRYPVGKGGAPMPYCMFFNKNQGLHGSNQLAEANLSHGCVRISVDDASWVRFNFATIGTKVIVMSY